VTVFPGLFMPAPLAGISVIDVTVSRRGDRVGAGRPHRARIAVAMSREADRSRGSTDPSSRPDRLDRDAA
jgi:hypothetical protein